MICKKDAPAKLATVTLDREEELHLAGLDVMIQNVMLDPVGYWSVELVLEPRAMNNHVDALAKRGFVISGNVSIDNVMFMRLKKRLSSPSFADTPRSVFFNPDLATPAPTLAPSKEESQARSALSASLEIFYSESASNARLAVIAAETVKFNSGRDEASDIATKAQRLAAATVKPAEG
jgi:hypothetical protein